MIVGKSDELMSACEYLAACNKDAPQTEGLDEMTVVARLSHGDRRV